MFTMLLKFKGILHSLYHPLKTLQDLIKKYQNWIQISDKSDWMCRCVSSSFHCFSCSWSTFNVTMLLSCHNLKMSLSTQ